MYSLLLLSFLVSFLFPLSLQNLLFLVFVGIVKMVVSLLQCWSYGFSSSPVVAVVIIQLQRMFLLLSFVFIAFCCGSRSSSSLVAVVIVCFRRCFSCSSISLLSFFIHKSRLRLLLSWFSSFGTFLCLEYSLLWASYSFPPQLSWFSAQVLVVRTNIKYRICYWQSLIRFCTCVSWGCDRLEQINCALCASYSSFVDG